MTDAKNGHLDEFCATFIAVNMSRDKKDNERSCVFVASLSVLLVDCPLPPFHRESKLPI